MLNRSTPRRLRREDLFPPSSAEGPARDASQGYCVTPFLVEAIRDSPFYAPMTLAEGAMEHLEHLEHLECSH